VLPELTDVWAKAVLLNIRRAAPKATFFMDLPPVNDKVDIERAPQESVPDS
jgi:hypothetical protein